MIGYRNNVINTKAMKGCRKNSISYMNQRWGKAAASWRFGKINSNHWRICINWRLISMLN